MKSQKYTKALKILQKHQEHLSAFGPQNEEALVKAEIEIGYKLPSAYRRFVAEFGTISFMGEEVFGVTNAQSEKSSIPNVVWATLNQRRTMGLPSIYLPIYAIGDGNFIYLKIGDQSYAPLVSLFKDSNNSFVEIPESSSFEDWFLALLEQAVEDFEEED